MSEWGLVEVVQEPSILATLIQTRYTIEDEE
jgi:hypothetical protein